MMDNTEATIDVYVDGDGKMPTSGTKVVDGQVADLAYTGYHTVKLDKPVGLAKGQRYAVVVTLKQTSGKRYAPLLSRGRRQQESLQRDLQRG